MKRIITTAIICLFTTICLAQSIKKTSEVAIPYKVTKGYFVKNTFKKDQLAEPKITTQKQFDAIFGTASFMGENGKPTTINFKKQYVIAVTIKETDLNTTLTPISLKKKSGKIVFDYTIVTGEKQTATMRPLLLIVVANTYKGKIVTAGTQTTIEVTPNEIQSNGLKLANNQWIIESFDNPKQNVLSKNCSISIDNSGSSFTGNDGCNSINGKVKVAGNSISFGKMIGTLMACKKMEQSALFVKNLTEVTSYKIIGGELFLYKNDQLIMTLESFK